jgi:PhnB protein
MPQLTAYLSFDGNCTEAMRFYERALGGKLTILMTNGQSPMKGHLPPGNDDRILHARLEFEGGVLMAGDSMVGMGPHQPMKGFNVVLNYDSTAQAKPVFEALAEGGNTTMQFSDAFWAEGFGMCVDRFGTPWIVNGALKTGWEN